MTVTINIPEYLAPNLTSISPEELEDVAVGALDARYGVAANVPARRRKLPPPSVLAEIRLEREARGDTRSGGEIAKEMAREEWRMREERLLSHAYRNDEVEVRAPEESLRDRP